MRSEILEVGAIFTGVLLPGVRVRVRCDKNLTDCCNVLISKLSQISSAWRNLAKYYREVGVW